MVCMNWGNVRLLDTELLFSFFFFGKCIFWADLLNETIFKLIQKWNLCGSFCNTVKCSVNCITSVVYPNKNV